MFGSKLRSWMENHIVRPRKKANKNKNNLDNNSTLCSVSSSNTHDGYKKTLAGAGVGAGFTLYQGNISVNTTSSTNTNPIFQTTGNQNSCSNSCISSPARRREVSPIASHTQSRYGWQSPDDDGVTSPKSDNFIYVHHHQRIRSQHLTAPNSRENSCEEKCLRGNSNLEKQTNQQLKEVDQQFLVQPQQDCSSSSISSLSWSTGSKDPSLPITNFQQIKTAVMNKMVNESSTITTNSNLKNNNIKELEEDSNYVQYDEIRNILRKSECNNRINNNSLELERPKSEQLPSLQPVLCRNFQDDISMPRYGRLLPSKISTQISSSDDCFNSNQLRCISAENIQNFNNNNHNNNNNSNNNSSANNNSNNNNNNNNNSNNNISNNINNYNKNNIRNNNNKSKNYCYSSKQDYDTQFKNLCPSLSSYFTNMTNTPTILTKGRLKNSSNSTQGINDQQTQANVLHIHSLSSPESAYSTGYSTDGTSPGAIYTPPEYYVNMRTGTHYFPKSINSLAIEAQRHKFGLNKIEEMSPIDPLPKTTFATAESRQSQNRRMEVQSFYVQPLPSKLGSHSPLVLPALKGFESPSPRQRSRIRTNPWYSTSDTLSSAGGTTQKQISQYIPLFSTSGSSTISSSKLLAKSSAAVKMEVETANIKLSNNENASNGNIKIYEKSYELSDSSSSLTEVENMQQMHSPNTIVRKNHSKLIPPVDDAISYQCTANVGLGSSIRSASNSIAGNHDVFISDDDATLNEMMGKFDESYVYEKETDILSSDSDNTDCPSELDTGQDAGDECDTDELLDIDFIDTASIQEVQDKKDMLKNLGSCYYYNVDIENSSPTQIRFLRRSRLNSQNRRNSYEPSENFIKITSVSSQRRRKRFFKTRKKSGCDYKDKLYNSPPHKSRESRSLGGTPVCLRRNSLVTKEKSYKTAQIVKRSSSLIFADVRERNFMAVSESEKALIKADLEANIKYKQLIMEAESILESIKNSVQSTPRVTPLGSPRRINPLTNKRVEMLKYCDADLKRETKQHHQQKQQQQQQQQHNCIEQELFAAINKRIESLKKKTNSAPNSPKFNRLSPRKTHLTNFINQNNPFEILLPVRKVFNAPQSLQETQSPQLQSNKRTVERGRRISTLLQQRRFRSQSPKMNNSNSATIDSDSDTDLIAYQKNLQCKKIGRHLNISLENFENGISHHLLKDEHKMFLDDGQDYKNINNCDNEFSSKNKNKINEEKIPVLYNRYCPQSEPLKRKVYKVSSIKNSYQKSFELESEIPKKALLAKINQLRRDRLSLSAKNSIHDLNLSSTERLIGSTKSNVKLNDFHKMLHEHSIIEPTILHSNLNMSKEQIILNTLADLKRSLENQSVELNGLNNE